MRERGCSECPVTVQELQDRFDLKRERAGTIAGFLKRLEYKPFFEYPFFVTRAERIKGHHPPKTTKFRYLVKRWESGGNEKYWHPGDTFI
jgi:hypothetical protein